MALVEREIYPLGSDSPLCVQICATCPQVTFLQQIQGIPLGELSIRSSLSSLELYEKVKKLSETSLLVQLGYNQLYVLQEVELFNAKGFKIGNLKLTLGGKQWLDLKRHLELYLELDGNKLFFYGPMEGPLRILTQICECAFSKV